MVAGNDAGYMQRERIDHEQAEDCTSSYKRCQIGKAGRGQVQNQAGAP